MQQFQDFIAQGHRFTLFMPTMCQHLMKRRLPRPGQKVRARLELIKAAPQDHLRLLQDVIRIMRLRHHAIDIHPQRTVVVREQFKEFLGAVGVRHGVETSWKRQSYTIGGCGGALDRKNHVQ